MDEKTGARPVTRPKIRRRRSAVPAAYRRRAWGGAAALVAFMALYAASAGWLVRTAWRLGSAGSGGGAGASAFHLVAAASAAFFAVCMIKAAFFVRPGRRDGCVELKPLDHPHLFQFLHKLADQAGAPRPCRVYVSARVDAALFYDLSLLNLLRPVRRNLEIGLGLVNAVMLSELRAVLAHEFGHFSPRPTAVGRWVYVARQVGAGLVAHRGRLDAVLSALAGGDPRVAWLGWPPRAAAWAIRSLLEAAFRGVLATQRALAREMELQADLVAVGLTGSDALIHALWKIEAADDAFDRTMRFAQAEKARGAAPRDFFAVQRHLTLRMAAALDDPTYGR
ncbi:MAG: M48 family metallopeptidase, partial [Burkholderiaceae bacterium]